MYSSLSRHLQLQLFMHPPYVCLSFTYSCIHHGQKMKYIISGYTSAGIIVTFLVHINVDFEHECSVRTLILFQGQTRCQCKASGLGGQIVESTVYKCFTDRNSLSHTSSSLGWLGWAVK
jgi:hypothetical protein